MAGALSLTVLLNGALVYWSLLPLRALETTAARVARGDLHARVPSHMADRHLQRIGQTLNALLDRLLSDQARVKYLSAQAIGASDTERAHLARELHDSTAQSLSAVEMLLTATCQDLADQPGPLKDRLDTMRDVVAEALHEVRTLSHRVHPIALEHLGLAAALDVLVRRTLAQSHIRHRLDTHVDAPLSPQVASVLYRVAQEAIGNALRHGRPRCVALKLEVTPAFAHLTIEDDGTGFDAHIAEQQRAGMGLFLMRERLMLVDGELEISSRPHQGTVIRVTAPNPHDDGQTPTAMNRHAP
jgi:two-component system NarL family sensor kinase